MARRQFLQTGFAVLALTTALVASAPLAGAAPTATDAPAATAAKQPAATGDVVTLDVVNTFKNQGTGRCLESRYVSGSQLIPSTAACHGRVGQQWNVHAWNDGTRQLRNVANLHCLDEFVLTRPCTSSPDMSWWVKRWNDGTIELKNQATGQCLQDNPNGDVSNAPCNASREQSWS